MLAAAILTLAFVAGRADAPAPVRLVDAGGGRRAVEVHVGREAAERLKKSPPAAKDWPAVLSVVVAEGSDREVAARPPIAGTYTVVDAAVRFEPLFPLVGGVKYRASFHPARAGGGAGAAPVVGVVSFARPEPGPPTSVTAVFPSASRLPENTLRLYIHFSGQMTRGDIYQRLQLVRSDGVVVPRPFLEIDEELWSRDGLRVTVLFHPGRVKRGLAPREQEGPILEEGRRYTLVVDRDWRDAEGRPLTAEVRKTFTVGPPEDEPVAPGRWVLVPPRAGSDAPLVVRLALPLDRPLLESMVGVTDGAGGRVEGRISVGGGERVVAFAPNAPWKAGVYKLVVDTRLEDPCGNRVGEPFEVDAFRPIERKIEVRNYERPFVVK